MATIAVKHVKTLFVFSNWKFIAFFIFFFCVGVLNGDFLFQDIFKETISLRGFCFGFDRLKNESFVFEAWSGCWCGDFFHAQSIKEKMLLRKNFLHKK